MWAQPCYWHLYGKCTGDTDRSSCRKHLWELKKSDANWILGALTAPQTLYYLVDVDALKQHLVCRTFSMLRASPLPVGQGSADLLDPIGAPPLEEGGSALARCARRGGATHSKT